MAIPCRAKILKLPVSVDHKARPELLLGVYGLLDFRIFSKMIVEASLHKSYHADFHFYD